MSSSTKSGEDEWAHLPPEVQKMRQEQFDIAYINRLDENYTHHEKRVKKSLEDEYGWKERQQRLIEKYSPKPKQEQE